MANEQLEVTAALVNQKVKFTGTARSNPAITIDYTPPVGDGEGYTSLELLLISLATCSGTATVSLLRKMRKTVTGLKVNAQGIRRDQHPLSFHTISLEFIVESPDATDADFQKVLQMAEDNYCPVWAMLKNNVEITAKWSILS